MSTATRVLAYVVALAVAFGLAWGVGNAVGPVGREAPKDDHGHQAATGEHGTDQGASGGAGAVPAGLQSTGAGYSLHLLDERRTAGRQEVAFVIHGPDADPVTSYDVQHEKELHLIAVRRDLTGFQHVHPRRDADGTWRIELDLTPGQWRLFADFKASGGPALVLGTDLAVSGDYRPEAPWAVDRTAHVDGYTVTLEGDLTRGESTLRPRITHDGAEVNDLEDYLGAKGHLVALRRGDLAYLHVHPEGLDFHAEVPSAGTYELWLDFKHDGVVHTAHFTLSTPGTEAAAEPAGADDTGSSGADDTGSPGDGHEEESDEHAH